MDVSLKTKKLLLWLLGLLLLHCRAQGTVHYYDFVLKEKNFTKLCETKPILVVNESFPGPTIRVHKGDTFFVNVHNQGYYGVTIHWHGVKQPRNPWSDGPEYITQCPIIPGSNFTYEVNLSNEEGTLWWHAHSDWTRATVHGAIVIYPKEGTSSPYPEPNGEEVLILGSWYIDDLTRWFSKTSNRSRHPQSDSYVINGEPGDLLPCSQGSTHRFVVDHGKTYLLRIINAAMNADLFLAIANHTLTVVGTDGNYVKPIITDYLEISPGQTMNVLVTANQSLGHYYLAVRQYYSDKMLFTEYDKANATAILMYSGNYTAPDNPVFPSSLPVYVDIQAADLFLSRFRSLASEEHPAKVPLNPTTRMFISVSMNELPCANASCDGLDGNKLAASLNNISFVNPTTDVLQAYYKNMTGVYTTNFPNWPPTFYDFTAIDFPPFNRTIAVQGTRVKVLEYNEEVEITFQGTEVLNASENHPMHMHGYSFFVLGSGSGNFDEETDSKTYNLIDPVEVNTVSVPKNGWATIRFKASNPGVWFWHCHFDRHLSWGMNTVMIVKDGGTPETSMRPPPPNMPSCEANAPFITWIEEFGDSNAQVHKK